MAIVLLLAGCGGSASGPAVGPPTPPPRLLSITAPDVGREPKVLDPKPIPPASRSLEARTSALPVEGYLPSVVIEPDGGPRPAPLVIVTHGAGDKPEPACAHYDELANHAAFILCIRGRATNTHLPEAERGYFYDGHIELGKELTRARDALLAAHPDEVDAKDVVFTGFSQGATMGVLALQQGAARELRVRRLLLVEGGAAQWNIAVAEGLRAAGVDRVAIVCGTVHCNDDAKKSSSWIERGGLELRLLYGQYAGHTLEGTMRGPIAEAWDWLASANDTSPPSR